MLTIIGIALLCSFALAYRQLSIVRPHPNTTYITPHLEVSFRRWKPFLTILQSIIGIVTAATLHYVLVAANRYFAEAEAPYIFCIWPAAIAWWPFPGIMALSLPLEVMCSLLKAFGSNKRAELYEIWLNQQIGYDRRLLFRRIGLLIALPMGFATALELSAHTALRDRDITQCVYGFAPCEHFTYTDARRLTLVRGYRSSTGKLIRRERILLNFTNGRQCFLRATAPLEETADPAILTFLQNRTRLPIYKEETAQTF